MWGNEKNEYAEIIETTTVTAVTKQFIKQCLTDFLWKLNLPLKKCMMISSLYKKWTYNKYKWTMLIKVLWNKLGDSNKILRIGKKII